MAASSPMCSARSKHMIRRSISCSTPRRRPSNSLFPHPAGMRPLDPSAQYRGAGAKRPGVRSRREGAGAGPLRHGVRGGPVSRRVRFGAELTGAGVTFRLWAPAARRVELLLGVPASDARAAGRLARGRRSRCAGRHALQVSHRRRDRGAGSGLGLSARGRFRSERNHRSRALCLACRGLARPTLAGHRTARAACRHVHAGRQLSRAPSKSSTMWSRPASPRSS